MPQTTRNAAAGTPTIRVLLTEDVAQDAELEIRELKRAGLRFVHRVVDSEKSFVSALREFAPDVILSDFSMPGFDGMAGLAIAREYGPEVVLLDISLPRLDGYETARRMREDESLRDVTLIAITGYGQSHDRARAAAAGFDHHLTKPVEYTSLQRLFRG